MDNLFNSISFFSNELLELIKLVDKNDLNRITEIRIRVNKPLIVYLLKEPYFLGHNGKLINHYNSSVYCTNEIVFEDTINRLCNNSIHTYISSLIDGYCTTDNGVRVGVCSTAIHNENEMYSIKNITSINVRIPRQHKDCSRNILNELYINSLPSVIIAGAPSAGKTTVIRDMARALSSGFNGKYRKVCVIDERNEIANGFDVGINTDYLMSFDKARGIEIATRTLSPDLLICDEIGNMKELKAIRYGFDSGISFVVTIHASSMYELINRPIAKELINTGQFDYIVLLKDYTNSFEVYSINKEKIIENSNSFINNDVFYIYGSSNH